jgi:hypothetical protein
MSSIERTVILNSRFRGRQDSATNFNILLNKSVAVDDVDRIIVKRVSMPNMFYNVPERKNKLYMLNNGISITITMPPGQYYIERFVETLEVLLQQDVNITASVTINIDTGKLKITRGPESGLLGWTVLSHMQVKEQFGVDESLNDMVGTSYNTTLTSSLSWNSPELVDLSGEHTIRIESSTLAFSNSFDSRAQILNTVEVVPMTEAFGNVCHFQPSDHILSFVDSGTSGRQINTIDIQLVSNSGQPLELPENSFVEIVLLVIFRNNQF